MKIYLDENMASERLVQLLKKNGFEVATPWENNLSGAPDRSHFEFCKKKKFPLLTKDAADFLLIHQESSHHEGIIAVYEEGVAQKNMSVVDIFWALQNLVKREPNLENHYFVLNQYRK